MAVHVAACGKFTYNKCGRIHRFLRFIVAACVKSLSTTPSWDSGPVVPTPTGPLDGGEPPSHLLHAGGPPPTPPQLGWRGAPRAPPPILYFGRHHGPKCTTATHPGPSSWFFRRSCDPRRRDDRATSPPRPLSLEATLFEKYMVPCVGFFPSKSPK
jgi:hypothetical protein